MTKEKSAHEITLKEVLNEILNVKNELKNFIEEGEARLLSKLDELTNKINKVEKENTELKNKIEILERKQKRNNIVIFGLNLNPAENLFDSVRQRLNKLLQVSLEPSDIINIYYLGNPGEKIPLKIELASYFKKQSILSQGKKIKRNRNLYCT